jgi:Zn-dependent protease with chaperone function
MDELTAARELLPGWVGWADLLLVPAAFEASALAAGLGAAVALTPLRRLPEGAHWTEFARLAWPARLTFMACLFWLPVFCGLLALLHGGPLAHTPKPLLVGLAAAGAFLAAALVGGPVVRRTVWPGLTPGTWLRSVAASVLIFWPPLIALVVLATLAPPRFGADALGWLGVGLVVLLIASSGVGLLVCRLVGLARPAGPRLRAAVGRAAERLGIRPPALDLLPGAEANALAFPLLRRVAVTDRLLDALGDEELAAVCAHELGHLVEPWPVLLGRLAAVPLLLALAAARPTVAAIGLLKFSGVVLAVWLGFVLLRRLARRMELRADRIAHGQDETAGTYARALEAMHRVNLFPAVLGPSRGLHPELYDRLTAAGAPPDYPRPKPPPGFWNEFGVVLALLPLVLLASADLVTFVVLTSPPPTEGKGLWVTALYPTARGLGALARLRAAADEPEQAAALWREAAAEDPKAAASPAGLAAALARLGRIEEAEARRRAVADVGNRSGAEASAMEAELAVKQWRRYWQGQGPRPSVPAP